MICEKCGAENNTEALFCEGCGNSFAKNEKVREIIEPEAEETINELPKIKSHMAAAIITTVLLGNWMLGIPAIVFARECEIAAEKNMYDVAGRFSKRALVFMCVGSALSLAVVSFVALAIILTRMIIL